MPTCYAPVRRAPSVLLQTRTRLACVKHAASVRSEPGSNSRLKLVAWAKKMLRFSSEPAYPSKLLSLDLLRPFGLEKAEWFRTDSGTSYRLSKSDKPPCPAERQFYSPMSIRIVPQNVNTRVTFSSVFLSFPQLLQKSFRRATMRRRHQKAVTRDG